MVFARFQSINDKQIKFANKKIIMLQLLPELSELIKTLFVGLTAFGGGWAVWYVAYQKRRQSDNEVKKVEIEASIQKDLDHKCKEEIEKIHKAYEEKTKKLEARFQSKIDEATKKNKELLERLSYSDKVISNNTLVISTMKAQFQMLMVFLKDMEGSETTVEAIEKMGEQLKGFDPTKL